MNKHFKEDKDAASKAGQKSSRKGIPNRTNNVYKELYQNIIGSFKNGCFYVYYHINKNTGEIVYIGKGKHNRAWNFADKSRNEDWVNYKIKNDLIVKIIVADLDEEEAFIIERELIKIKNPILNIQSNY